MSDNDKLKPRIPTLADFLVAFPTVPGMEEELYFSRKHTLKHSVLLILRSNFVARSHLIRLHK